MIEIKAEQYYPAQATLGEGPLWDPRYSAYWWIDIEDNLWVAFWGGWCIAMICPVKSQVLGKVVLPVSNVTACAFGGSDLDQLLITTASIGLDDDARKNQPLAGDSFVADTGTRTAATGIH